MEKKTISETDSDIFITNYNYVDKEKELIQLRNETRDDKKDSNYFTWRYKNRPSGKSAKVVIASINNKHIGILAIIPHKYIVDGKNVVFGVIGDISVLESFRGQGVANRIMSYVIDNMKEIGFSYLFILPNEPIAKILKKDQRWIRVVNARRYARILSIENNNKITIGFIRGVAEYIYIKLSNILFMDGWSRLGGQEKTKTINTIPKEYDELWKKINKKEKVMVARDREYMEWRYHYNPSIKYSIFTLVNSNKLVGCVVYTINKGICNVADIITEKNNGNHIISLFIAELKKEGVVAINLRIYCAEIVHLSWLLLGFIPRRDYREGYITSYDDNSLDKYNWYFTIGDKDT